MEFIREHKKEVIFFSIFFLIIIAIAGWFYFVIYLGDKKLEEEMNNQDFDLTDVNNVDAVESRLDYKMKISQGYLLTYTTNKSGIWYMSSAIVSKIKVEGTDAYVTLTNKDNTHKLVAEIESSRISVKKGDSVNFVGTIDLETGNIELAKLSKDTINYSNVTEMDFSKLVDNINKVKANIFVVSGYMITEGDRYKLFESKTAYKENNNVGEYFTISWDKEFNYTGNANVTLECKLNGTYKLKDCSLVE